MRNLDVFAARDKYEGSGERHHCALSHAHQKGSAHAGGSRTGAPGRGGRPCNSSRRARDRQNRRRSQPAVGRNPQIHFREALKPSMQKTDIVASPPTYAEIGTAVRILDGEQVQHVRELMNTLFDHAGSAEPSHDWSDPDCWIDERLTGELRTLACKVWTASAKTINPRFLYDHSTFISR